MKKLIAMIFVLLASGPVFADDIENPKKVAKNQFAILMVKLDTDSVVIWIVAPQPLQQLVEGQRLIFSGDPASYSVSAVVVNKKTADVQFLETTVELGQDIPPPPPTPEDLTGPKGEWKIIFKNEHESEKILLPQLITAYKNTYDKMGSFVTYGDMYDYLKEQITNEGVVGKLMCSKRFVGNYLDTKLPKETTKKPIDKQKAGAALYNVIKIMEGK